MLKWNVKRTRSSFYCKHWELAVSMQLIFINNFNKNLDPIIKSASKTHSRCISDSMSYTRFFKYHFRVYEFIDGVLRNLEERVIAYHCVLIRCLSAVY